MYTGCEYGTYCWYNKSKGSSTCHEFPDNDGYCSDSNAVIVCHYITLIKSCDSTNVHLEVNATVLWMEIKKEVIVSLM